MGMCQWPLTGSCSAAYADLAKVGNGPKAPMTVWQLRAGSGHLPQLRENWCQSEKAAVRNCANLGELQSFAAFNAYDRCGKK